MKRTHWAAMVSAVTLAALAAWPEGTHRAAAQNDPFAPPKSPAGAAAKGPAPAVRTPAPAAEGGAASAPTSLPAGGGVIKLKHMTIDRAKRRITLDAEVCFTPGPLEFFLCRKDTKDYESILSTPVQPSDLHAALLAMGLTTGKPARMGRPDTQPARFLPPDGPKITVDVQWKDANGLAHEVPASAWLATTGKKKDAPLPKEWIFVGSEVLPGGQYLADSEGAMISMVNVSWTVLDIPSQSTWHNYAALELTGDANAIPPKQTPVTVVLTVLPGGEKSPAARALVEIDRAGRYWIEGKQYGLDDLAGWANQYLDQHAEGMVVLRADGLARIDDLEQARDRLRMAGVSEIDDQLLPGPDEPTPRVPEQAAAALKRWRAKFEKWDKLLMDPFEEAQEHLKEVQQEMKLLEARKAMLSEYATQLQTDLSKSKAATQSAK